MGEHREGDIEVREERKRKREKESRGWRERKREGEREKGSRGWREREREREKGSRGWRERERESSHCWLDPLSVKAIPICPGALHSGHRQLMRQGLEP